LGIPYFRLELKERGGYFELFWWLDVIAGSKRKSGQLEGGRKNGRKPPKMAAQEAAATAAIFYRKGVRRERKWRVGSCYFC